MMVTRTQTFVFWMLAATAAVGVAPVAAQTQGAAGHAPEANCGKEYFARDLAYRGTERGQWLPESTLTAPEYRIIEVSRYHPNCPPTPQQIAAADEFVVRTFLTARQKGWFDFEKATKDGFAPHKPDATVSIHFVNTANSLDDRMLDPEHPEYLMFYDTPEGMLLVGVMYFVRTPEERGPQIAGPLTVWHYHQYADPACIHEMQMSSAKETANGIRCEQGKFAGYQSPEMLHVWFVDHPDGAYATSMGLTWDILQGGIRKDLLALGDEPGSK